MTEPSPRSMTDHRVVVHPEWSRTSALYQVNQRQLTEAGTFAAAQSHLKAIKDLGCDIVWLMPVNPIGEVNRKGTLGSPYAVKDHRAVNPEFGTMADLREYVDVAHALGLRVILDWVANHTAWDHHLTTEHPEWFARDYKGDFRPTPWWDWDDIIDLDYAHEGVRDYMVEAMELFVREADVDGFRCDVAGFVPMDFWREARTRLDAIKPVFMLAEWETRDLHDGAFDASYAWGWNDALHKIAAGKTDLEPLRIHYAWNERSWPDEAMRMTFVSNHDHNHADGTEYERFGDALPAAIALSVIGDGIPLVYTGQELGNRERLAFFDKDLVSGDDTGQADLYRELLSFKRKNPALHNSPWGGRMVRIANTAENRVLTFVRQDPTDDARVVFAAFNLCDQPREVTVGEGPLAGVLTHRLGDLAGLPVDTSFAAGTTLSLPAWGYGVWSR